MSKEIRKPDDPAKKTSDSLMTKIKKKLDGLKTAKNDKIITYVITAIIAICLGVYVITQFVMDNKSTKENNTTQEGQEFVIPDSNDPTVEDTDPAATNSQSPYHQSAEAVTDDNNDGFIIPDADHVTLKTTNDQNACYVYIPVGYEANIKTRSVLLKPVDYDINITDNDPISIEWDNMAHFYELKADGYYNVLSEGLSKNYTRYEYEVIDKYEYLAHETASAMVYIIHIIAESEEPELSFEMYKIVVDLPSKTGAIPMITFDNVNQDMLNNRYPDIISLAKAIFIPVNEEDRIETPMETDVSEEPKETKNE